MKHLSFLLAFYLTIGSPLPLIADTTQASAPGTSIECGDANRKSSSQDHAQAADTEKPSPAQILVPRFAPRTTGRCVRGCRMADPKPIPTGAAPVRIRLYPATGRGLASEPGATRSVSRTLTAGKIYKYARQPSFSFCLTRPSFRPCVLASSWPRRKSAC